MILKREWEIECARRLSEWWIYMRHQLMCIYRLAQIISDRLAGFQFNARMHLIHINESRERERASVWTWKKEQLVLFYLYTITHTHTNNGIYEVHYIYTCFSSCRTHAHCIIIFIYYILRRIYIAIHPLYIPIQVVLFYYMCLGWAHILALVHLYLLFWLDK